MVIFFYNEALFVRFSEQLIDNIPILNTNTSYWGTWRSGLQQGLENFWMGVGPTGSRHTCGLLGEHWLPGVNYCGNHPHNFYIQMFAETGFIGFIFIFSLFIYLLYLLIIRKRSYCDSEICILAGFFVVLWPITTNGNFFNNWINLISFYPLGFLLYIMNEKVKEGKKIV